MKYICCSIHHKSLYSLIFLFIFFVFVLNIKTICVPKIGVRMGWGISKCFKSQLKHYVFLFYTRTRYYLSQLSRSVSWRTIVLSINHDKQYIIRYIFLKGLLIRYKNSILAHIFDISSDIRLSNMITTHPIQIWYLIFRTLLRRS